MPCSLVFENRLSPFNYSALRNVLKKLKIVKILQKQSFLPIFIQHILTSVIISI